MVRLNLDQPRPWQCLTLRPAGRCSWWSRMLLQQEMILGPLLPGRYCLEVGTLELLLSLSPGANLTLWVNVEQGQYRWRQDRFHCAWNQG